MPRLRDCGLAVGRFPVSPHNALTDVPGVTVGHATVVEGERIRTGVTVISPHSGDWYAEPVPAAVYTVNGYGKPIGFEQVRELGVLETPIALTTTLCAPRAADALIQLTLERNPEPAATGSTVNPLVAECNDSFLNDGAALRVGLAEVRAALAAATADPPAEGCVGAGTGMSCFGWKGGVGTAGRRAAGFVLGALALTNFGRAEELLVDGAPIGRHLKPPPGGASPPGSVVIVLATDAPLDGRQLGRLCRRAAFGVARTGGVCHPGSGEFVIAFQVAWRAVRRPPTAVVWRPVVADEAAVLAELGAAAVEAVEEAILNSLFAAHTMTGRDGHTRVALPVDDVVRLWRSGGR